MDGQEWIRCMDQARAVEMVGGRRGRHGRCTARLADRDPACLCEFRISGPLALGRPGEAESRFGVWTAPWVNHKNLSSLGPCLVGPCLVLFFCKIDKHFRLYLTNIVQSWIK